MLLRQGPGLSTALLISLSFGSQSCKTPNSSSAALRAADTPAASSAFEAVPRSPTDEMLLATEDDCAPMRRAIATRKSESNLVNVEEGELDGHAHTFISVYPNSREGSNGVYDCKAAIVLDQSHMTLRGANNAVIKMRSAPLSPAPLLVLGTIDPPVYDDKTKGWDKIRIVKNVHAANFFLDGNRVEQLHANVHLVLAEKFVEDTELAKVFLFASEVAEQLSLKQAYKYPGIDQIEETLAPLRRVVADAKAGTAGPRLTQAEYALFEANVFKVKNILRAARNKISARATPRLPVLKLIPTTRLGKYIDLGDATKASDAKLMAYLKDAVERLDKYVNFYRNTVNVYECWLLDRKPELGKVICDNNAHPTSHIRNNGVTIRGVHDGSVKNVTAINTLSGGMVTEKNCERLFVDQFESTENYYDGFAGYKTKDSTFCRMNLHANNNAAISIDQHFSHNTFEKSRFFQNGDVGIFARESEDNLFKNVTIIGNRNHGVFLSEVDANGPVSGAHHYKFVDSCIAYSEGFGIRLNDAGSSPAELRNVIMHENLMEGLSLADGAKFEPNDVKTSFDTSLCKAEERAFHDDYKTSCAKRSASHGE